MKIQGVFKEMKKIQGGFQEVKQIPGDFQEISQKNEIPGVFQELLEFQEAARTLLRVTLAVAYFVCRSLVRLW